MFLISVKQLFMCIAIYISVVASNAVSKRSDVDLQTCIDNFEVYKDKIIRTQDSRSLGAKYINEIDLGSREECLRLCCETNTCDVFVYEEKSPGSCYLFHCGPQEDFKCKFTRHANYSSAVFSINRHMSELENQIKLTKHEKDLSRLRKLEDTHIPPEVNNQEVTRITSTQHPLTTTIQSKILKELLPQIDANKTVTGRRCSRFQFECRTSGECIAIYNACDGIPQCTDASDEAPELGCPELGTTAAPSPPPPPLPLPVVRSNIYEQNNQLRKSLPPLMVDNYQQSAVVQSNSRLPSSVDVSRDNTDFLRPASEVRGQAVGQQASYNEPQIIQQPQQPFVPPRPSVNNNWINHQANQIPVLPANMPYGDKNSHIFNHKESGLQVVDTPDRYKYKGAMQTLHRALALGQYIDTTRGGAGPQYVDMRNDYQKNYYSDMYRPQYQLPENWPQNRAPINGDLNPYINNDNWQPVQVPPSTNINEQSSQTYRQNIDAKQNWKADLINTQAESKAYDHTIIREPKEYENKAPVKEEEKQDTTKTSEDHEHDLKNIKKEIVTQHKEHPHAHIPGAEELKQNIEDLMDGEAERPGGAILSLTLGVCLTCVMAILIGCRLRIVRRRMRRGGKSPYAHDADYLVNGMYL